MAFNIISIRNRTADIHIVNDIACTLKSVNICMVIRFYDKM